MNKINSAHTTFLLKSTIKATRAMEQIVLDAIKQVRDVSKKEMDIKIILRKISTTSAANLIKIEINEMTNKEIIDKSYKMLNEHGLQQTKEQMEKETLITPGDVHNDNSTQHSVEASSAYVITKHHPDRPKIKRHFKI